MYHIVLTGGPCAGKSQSLSKIFKYFTEKRNWNVFIVPETATELLANGITPNKDLSMVKFQEFILDKQLAKDNLYIKIASHYNTDKTIILYDRGILDQLAYCSRNELEQMLKERNLSFSEIISKYDCVIHLTTAAKGAVEFYEWSGSGKECNNSARRETPEEAIDKDEKTLKAWVGHPHLRVIDNSTDFQTKIDRVIEEICSVIGEPTPTEIEKKFLIEKPNIDILNSLDYISENSIIQTYLKSDNSVERRVRQRGREKDGYNFYYTEKKEISGEVREEKEYKISSQEYTNYLIEADTSLHQISKIRYCFIYENQYFELDIYPFSDKYAILEIELKTQNEEVKLPPFIKVIKEVTDDKKYKNHALAKTLSFDIDTDNV